MGKSGERLSQFGGRITRTVRPTGGSCEVDRIALISDIHGNIPALEAVLRDIRDRGVDRILCLGDLAGKGPSSASVVDICRDKCEVTLKGNWDDFIASNDHPTALWHQQRLGTARLDFLRNLAHTTDFHFSGRRVRLFHSSQLGIYHRVFMNDDMDKQRAMFTNTEFTGYEPEPDFVAYGDVHTVYLRHFYDRTLLNVGSVDNPLDLTLASYVILEGEYGAREHSALSIHLMRVPYDIELAIEQARDADMPTFELYRDELRTARYRRSPQPRQEA
jgi:predicted phosphodiesterase